MTEELEKLLAAATPGPWHHVQAFERVPAVRTIHGRVPGQRVDYVSTWPGPGTPKGHRVVIPMETVAEGHVVQTARSADMALIVAAVNALPELIAVKAERDRAQRACEQMGQRITALESLVRVLLENEPDDPVSDGGHTVLDLWRHDARAALNQEPKP